jgi:hypothetical protein
MFSSGFKTKVALYVGGRAGRFRHRVVQPLAMQRLARRPLGLQLFNGLGRAAGMVGLPLVRLDAVDLLQRVARRARLEDFGDDAFRAPFRVLLASLEHEASLTLLGRMIARTDLVRLLENRLYTGRPRDRGRVRRRGDG